LASVLFTGDAEPYTITDHYMPIGANLAAGLIEPIIFGGRMILIRSEVFAAVGQPEHRKYHHSRL
jgi:hypothetical protein